MTRDFVGFDVVDKGAGESAWNQPGIGLTTSNAKDCVMKSITVSTAADLCVGRGALTLCKFRRLLLKRQSWCRGSTCIRTWSHYLQPRGKILVSVLWFYRIQTGQYKPQPNSNFSTAVQGWNVFTDYGIDRFPVVLFSRREGLQNWWRNCEDHSCCSRKKIDSEQSWSRLSASL